MKKNISALLKEIKSEEIETVYIATSHKAVEWAVAGFMQEANRLLETLWSYGTPHSGHLWVPDQGLMVMWEVSGIYPSNIPFPLNDTASIEAGNFTGLFTPSWAKQFTQTIADVPIAQLTGHKLFVKAVIATHYKLENIATILDAFERHLQSQEAVGHSYFQSATCAAILAAHNNNIEKAATFINLWGQGYLKYSENYTLAYLMRDRPIATLLLKGILAPVFGLTKEVCRKQYEQISVALAERYTAGQGLVYGNLSWMELLQKISKLAVEQETSDFSKEAISSRWLGQSPNNKAEIAALEKRLGVILPGDYKEFLLASNGFAAISFTDVALAPVDKVNRLIDADKDLVLSWVEAMADVDTSFSAKFSNSIIIGGHEEEQQLLLIPLENNQWECWFFANWVPGQSVYPALRFYMEEVLQRLEEGFYTN
jgi:hypothetical protein